MSYPAEHAAVTVHRAADPPDIAGPPTVRFVAPGSVTAGRYGVVRVPDRGPQPRPIRMSGRELSPGEWVQFYARHDQVNL